MFRLNMTRRIAFETVRQKSKYFHLGKELSDTELTLNLVLCNECHNFRFYVRI